MLKTLKMSLKCVAQEAEVPAVEGLEAGTGFGEFEHLAQLGNGSGALADSPARSLSTQRAGVCYVLLSWVITELELT